jgi:hypothetical protein
VRYNNPEDEDAVTVVAERIGKVSFLSKTTGSSNMIN